MFDPIEPPYRRQANYTDPIPPDVDAAWYNGTQDTLRRLFGAALGLSTTAVCDDLDRESPGSGLGVVVAGGYFGTKFLVKNSLNANARSVSPSEADSHGVWRIAVLAAGAYDYELGDNRDFIGEEDFILCARLRLGARARLRDVVDPPVFPPPPDNEGFIWGLGGRVTDLPVFLAGGNLANWQAWADGTLTDTGVPIVDDRWYVLLIARREGTVRWYVKQPTDELPVQVHEQVFAASFTDSSNYLRINGPAGVAGDFCDVDKLAKGIAR